MKVLFLTQFSELGGSSRIQVIQFLPVLSRMGVECVSRPLYSDYFYKVQMGIIPTGKIFGKIHLILNLFFVLLKKLYYVLVSWRYDIVLIQKETFPQFLFSIMRRINSRVIYELDDTIYEINPHLERGFFESVLLRYQSRLCRNMMKGASFVITENDYLANEARKYNRNVTVLAAPIDADVFRPITVKEQKDRIVIGWIGSPSTTYLLESITPALCEFARKCHNVELRVVGVSLQYDIPCIKLIKKPWDLKSELLDLQSFDIGLMPLDDMPFNRGRLGYKMIQYMSVGIPIVASDIGLNRTIIKDGENGFLARSLRNWVEKLVMLAGDEDLRKRIGSSGRRMVEKQFSLKKKSKVYLDVFASFYYEQENKKQLDP